ncbi:uncharacterized protein BDV17DRAFT_209853 [Aspergillus undulatus]|uniref:uncharacterized protein n=1 Tax=Aspergillus undulatus TaxID=1810928 RepID=UPI003CCCBF49
MILLAFIAPAITIDSASTIAEWKVTDPIDSPQSSCKNMHGCSRKPPDSPTFENGMKLTPKFTDHAWFVCHPSRILDGSAMQVIVLRVYEDPYDTTRYERDIKSCLPPFLLFHRNSAQGLAELRITLNVQTPLHQAHGNLLDQGTASFHWRLIPIS